MSVFLLLKLLILKEKIWGREKSFREKLFLQNKATTNYVFRTSSNAAWKKIEMFDNCKKKEIYTCIIAKVATLSLKGIM